MCVINKILSLHRAKGDPKFLNSEVITLYIVPKKFLFLCLKPLQCHFSQIKLSMHELQICLLCSLYTFFPGPAFIFYFLFWKLGWFYLLSQGHI